MSTLPLKRIFWRSTLLCVLCANVVACGDDDSNDADTSNNAANNTPNNTPNNDPNNDPNNTPAEVCDDGEDNDDDGDADCADADCADDAACQEVDPVADCNETCLALIERCSAEFAEACPVEEVVEQLPAACAAACDVEEGQVQIGAAGDLPCGVVAGLAIDGFGLAEQCGGESPEPLFAGLLTSSSFEANSTLFTGLAFDGEFEELSSYELEGTDVVLRLMGGSEVAVINRATADIEVYDLAEFPLAAEEIVFNAGEGSNPQDALRVGDRVVVPRYDSPSLLIVDGTTYEELATVDLSAVHDEDTDGIPEMSAAFDIGGGLVAVVLQNLVEFAPLATSRLAIVDVAQGTLARSVTLPGGNPFVAQMDDEGQLLIALIANFGDTAGQVVRFNPEDDSITEGIFTEAQAGGDINGFAATEAGFAVIISTPEFTTKLVHVVDGAAEEILSTPGFDLGSVNRVGDFLTVTNSDLDNLGLHVFNLDFASQGVFVPAEPLAPRTFLPEP